MKKKNEPIGTGIPHGSKVENERFSAKNDITTAEKMQTLVGLILANNAAGDDLSIHISKLSMYISRWSDITESTTLTRIWADDPNRDILLDGAIECLRGWLE